jgi:hypothetical protein
MHEQERNERKARDDMCNSNCHTRLVTVVILLRGVLTIPRLELSSLRMKADATTSFNRRVGQHRGPTALL